MGQTERKWVPLMMTGTEDFWVRLWGVRGSVPCSGTQTVRYGGNTACVEVGCGSERLIFDMGTGIRLLGNAMMADGVKKARIYLSHTHLDHIGGFAFFKPIYCEDCQSEIWAGHLTAQGLSLRDTLCQVMSPTLFPIGIDAMLGRIVFRDFVAGETLQPAADVTLRTLPLRHPGGATGYRIEYAGKSVCYVTDVEHEPERRDEALVAFVGGAEILIYDCTYTDEEFPKYRGWGHSTWEEGVRLCEAAGAKRLVTFHHAPSRDDAALDAIADRLDQRFQGARVGREGLVLHP